MIKKVILAASLCLSLAACSDSKSGDKPPSTDLTTEEVTNKSMCSGRTPVDTNLYSNQWVTKTQVSNGVVLTQVYDFNHDRAIVTFSAEYKDQFKKLRTYADFEDRGYNTLALGGSEEISDSIQVDGKPFRFSLAFSAFTVNYKFLGPCLVLSDSKNRLTLAPYHY